MKAIAVLAVAFLATCSPVTMPATGGPTVQTNIKYYTVYGQTGRALKASMADLGPNGFWGYTHSRVKWPSPCRVSVKVVHTYPKLKDRSNLSPKLLVIWDAMMVELIKHEEFHAEITIKIAKRIQAANCENAGELFSEAVRLNNAFDDDTNHGIKRGILLPD